MNAETNFMSFEDLTKLIEEHKKETHPYKRYEFDSTSYTMLLISINNLIKENQELKEINEEHKKLNGDLRKENQEIRLDQTKKVFHVLTHLLLNGGCTYRYLIYDLLYFKPENYSDLIEGMNIVNAIATLEELKEQVENKEDFINKLQATKDKLDKWDYENTMKQKEFIKYMNDIIKDLETEDVDDEEMKGYLIQRIDTFKEILQKYKEIIGVSDEKN